MIGHMIGHKTSHSQTKLTQLENIVLINVSRCFDGCFHTQGRRNQYWVIEVMSLWPESYDSTAMNSHSKRHNQ